jgi:hypothetical protein
MPHPFVKVISTLSLSILIKYTGVNLSALFSKGFKANLQELTNGPYLTRYYLETPCDRSFGLDRLIVESAETRSALPSSVQLS